MQDRLQPQPAKWSAHPNRLDLKSFSLPRLNEWVYRQHKWNQCSYFKSNDNGTQVVDKDTPNALSDSEILSYIPDPVKSNQWTA